MSNSDGMSDRAAEVEALRRFGSDGRAWHHPQARPEELWYCCVGLRRGANYCLNEYLILGKGATFEEAFADAARRSKGKKA